MCHELPEYWAHGLYFKPHAGRLPDDDPDADLSAWEVRPAPPTGSPAWTLEAVCPICRQCRFISAWSSELGHSHAKWALYPLLTTPPLHKAS